MKTTPLTIGIDLDNTIIRYDDLIYDIAVERGVIPKDMEKNKKKIRDHIRTLSEGDIGWQKIQGMIYGSMVHLAKPFVGVADFLKQCREASCTVYVISHKTQYANYDDTKTDLRKTALAWLSENFVNPDAGGLLDMENIFFGATRREKIDMIYRLHCHWFIDDLEETFMEPGFPRQTEKVLFGKGNEVLSKDVLACATWREIKEKVFG